MVEHGLKVLNAWFVETGTAPDMVSRNLITHVDPTVVRQFDLQTRGGEMMTSDNLAGIAGKIVRPDANFERQVQIAGGWASTRYRFVLRVGNPNVQNGTVWFYTGYTDQPAFSFNKHDFAPDMRMYFNTVLQVVQTMRHTPTGPVPYVNVTECNHLLHPYNLGSNPMDFATTFNPNGGFAVQNQPTSLRPVDLMYNLSSKEKANMSGMGGTQVFDTRSAVDLCKSSRRNNVPSHYLSKAANSLVHGLVEASGDPTSTSYTPYDIAAGHTNESGVYSDRFFSILANEFGYHQYGYITWADFTRSHPEMNQTGVTFVMSRGEAQKQDIYISDRGNFDSMVNDRRPQTMLITQIMQSVPAVLLESLITVARIHVTNMTPSGEIQVTLTDPISFVDLPAGYLIPMVPTIERRLQHIIFNDIAANQFVPFDLYLTVDLFGESFANMSYNGEMAVPYSIPTYCDSMMSPIVTTNGGVLGQMSNDVQYLISQVCGV